MIELWDNRRVHRLVRTLETKVEAETMIADQKVNLKRYDKISAVLQDAEGQLENEEDKMDTNEHAAVNAVRFQKGNQHLYKFSRFQKHNANQNSKGFCPRNKPVTLGEPMKCRYCKKTAHM